MNVQERMLVTQFLQQLAAAKTGQKDPEADGLIREAFAQQPDAAYLLVQRAMQLEHALQALQTQVVSLQQDVEQLRAQQQGQSGFLDGGNAWGRAGATTSVVAATGGAPVAQRAAQPAQAAPAASPSAWGSGLFGNIASTAAGVVAGSFLFQGIGNLLGHRGGSGLWTNPAQQPHVTENTTINNYYGNDDTTDDEDDSTDVADADTDPGDVGDSSDYA